ncbi:hypothetical protein AUP42_01645 [Thalassospira lucentensis]|uniref:Phage infection protein n=1 Tax=Thalassospira lucentensis TaxID=168935 RepID=A0A154L3T9_9PROT|nr:hypothetical protein [Thalassospira lucentensis]KZB63123.1 hypothetical protein AUP42_01645 [Thalassospira lucentensis]
MTDKLKINLQHCYGIGKLEAELEFKHKGYAIYAPNGVMKTSFAKTMMDISEGKKPSDLHFPDREPTFEITLNDEMLKRDEIFVVKSYDDKFASNQVSTLLANAELRKKYEEIHRSIGEAKKALDKVLKHVSGFGEKSRENIDPIIEELFGGDYYEALTSIEEELRETQPSELSNADYKILYDPKVQQFLSSEDVAEAVEEFAKKYDEITEKSPILRRNFQYHNISQIQQNLAANNFFSAGHKISLADKNNDDMEDVSSDQNLLERITEEKLRILSNEEVGKRFDTFNSKLKNKELQAFRDYITENKHILPRLHSPEELKRDLWVQYLLRATDEYQALIKEYKAGQSELAQIISDAERSRGDWDSVVEDFNRRFLYLPFELTVQNKADAILKGSAPSIGFLIRDSGEERLYAPSEKQDLLRALSTGEGRALYILDIMYEVYVRWKDRIKTLFVFDDISDSFDYKNKFAIIDFLEDVTKSEDNSFLAIVLTHNFDFLRTIASRQICPAHQCRLAFRSDSGISLEQFSRTDIQSPFLKWQGRLSEPSVLTAYIPFLRNVIEYSVGTKNAAGNDNEDYLQLTRMLHFKDETETLTLRDYKTVFEQNVPHGTFPEVNLDQPILEHIFASADACETVDEGINLEHKIALSIAIRAWAERYMVTHIRSTEPEYDIAKKQTGELFQKFKDLFNNQTDRIGLLRRVNLITPANIHINAFMYEPILDMGMGELVSLYQDVKNALR